MLKKLFYLGLIAAFVGGFIAYRMVTKPHTNIAKQKVDMTISAKELASAYVRMRSEEAADSTYSQKMLLVTGKIVEIKLDSTNNGSLMLESGDSTKTISCTFDPFAEKSKTVYQVGQEVKLQGICAGINMGDIQMDRCVPVK
jgi:tRNA_anti-like